MKIDDKDFNRLVLLVGTETIRQVTQDKFVSSEMQMITQLITKILEIDDIKDTFLGECNECGKKGEFQESSSGSWICPHCNVELPITASSQD